MPDSNLNVGIESREAVAGANTVIRSINDISAAANNLQTKLQSMEASMGKIGASSGMSQARRAMNDLNSSSNDLHKMLGSIEDRFIRIGATALAMWAVTKAFEAMTVPLKLSVEYLALIETATLGIASSLLVVGQYQDTVTGKVLQGQHALSFARKESKEIIDQLRVANMDTIATLDELIVAYQTALPVAMARGFDKKQVMDFTLAMVQAAGAIGLPFNQMSEEIRSLLTEGAINPRNSRIATVMGLRNEDLAEYKGNAQGLFDFLMNKLEGFTVAGQESQKTMKGIWSNLTDVAKQLGGDAFSGVFEGLKTQLKALLDSVVTFDSVARTATWNEAWVEGAKSVNEWVTTTFNTLVDVGKGFIAHADLIWAIVKAYTAYQVVSLASSVITKSMAVASGQQMVVDADRMNYLVTSTRMEQEAAAIKLAQIKNTEANVVAEQHLNAERISSLRAIAMQNAEEIALAKTRLSSAIENARNTVSSYAAGSSFGVEASRIAIESKKELNLLLSKQAFLEGELQGIRTRGNALLAQTITLEAELTAAAWAEAAARTAAQEAELAQYLNRQNVLGQSIAGAATSAGTAFNAIGGWITVTIAALYLLYRAWEELNGMEEKYAKDQKAREEGLFTNRLAAKTAEINKRITDSEADTPEKKKVMAKAEYAEELNKTRLALSDLEQQKTEFEQKNKLILNDIKSGDTIFKALVYEYKGITDGIAMYKKDLAAAPKVIGDALDAIDRESKVKHIVPPKIKTLDMEDDKAAMNKAKAAWDALRHAETADSKAFADLKIHREQLALDVQLDAVRKQVNDKLISEKEGLQQSLALNNEYSDKKIKIANDELIKLGAKRDEAKAAVYKMPNVGINTTTGVPIIGEYNTEAVQAQKEYVKLNKEVTDQTKVITDLIDKKEKASTKAEDAIVKAGENEIKKLIELEKEYTTLINSVGAFNAAQTGVDSLTGIVIDSKANSIAKINEAYKAQINVLDDTYDKYVELYNLSTTNGEQEILIEGILDQLDKKYTENELKRIQDVAKAENSALYGMSDAMNEYANSAMNIGSQIKDAFVNAFKGMEDALVSMVMTGKADFKSMANSIIADIVRITVKQQLMGPLVATLGGMLSPSMSMAASTVGAFSSTGGLGGGGGTGGIELLTAGNPGMVALTTESTSALSSGLGGAISSAMPYLAVAMAGYTVFKMGQQYFGKGGGWDDKSGDQKAITIGASALSLGIIPVIDYFAKGNLFGTKWKATGTGVSLGVEDGDIGGQSYTDSKKKKALWGGNKYKTDYGSLDDPWGDFLSTQFDAVKQSIYTKSAALGITISEASMDGFNSSVKKIQLSGLDSEGQQKAITQYFRDLSNEAIKFLVPDIESMTRLGEDFTAAYERMNALKLANNSLLMKEMELLGTEASNGYRELLNTQRQAELANMDASTQVIQKRVWLLEDEKKTTEKLNTLQKTNNDLMKGLLSSFGNSDQVVTLQRQLELKDITDESTKSIKQYVWAMQDQIAAQAKATALAKTATLDSIAQTKSILQTKLALTTGASAQLSPEAAYLQSKAMMNSSDKTNVSANVQAFIEQSKQYNASGTAFQADMTTALAKLGEFTDSVATGPTEIQQQITLLDAIANAVSSDNGALVSKLTTTWNALQIVTGSAATPAKTEYDKLVKLLSGIDPTYTLTDTASTAIDNAILAVKDSMAGTIDTQTATTRISNAYQTVKDSLGAGLTGTNSVSDNLATFNQALADSAKITKDGLTDFVNALAIVSDYTRQRSEAQTAIGALGDQYRSNTLSPDTYATKVSEALAPLNATISAGSKLGLSSLTTPSTSLTVADDDAHMKAKAGIIADIITPYIGNASLYNPKFDIVGASGIGSPPDGAIKSADQVVWREVAQGITKWSTLGLPAFANGGITNGPSIAGEGIYREAVIPLPDGRTVPVTINGSADNKETVAELKEQNRLLRALLNVSQAGLTRVANATEKTAESTIGMEQKTRLQAAA